MSESALLSNGAERGTDEDKPGLWETGAEISQWQTPSALRGKGGIPARLIDGRCVDDQLAVQVRLQRAVVNRATGRLDGHSSRVARVGRAAGRNSAGEETFEWPSSTVMKYQLCSGDRSYLDMILTSPGRPPGRQQHLGNAS